MVLPAYDNHLHLSPSGRNIDALREFQAAGGTGLTLVTLPYQEVIISDGSDFRRSFDITLSLAAKAREMTDLKVNVSVGPYPVLLLSLTERFGLEKAERIMIEGMEIAASFVAVQEDGKVIGFLHVDANLKRGLGILHSIGVDPRVFARGVGKALVAEAEKFWRQHRMRKIYTCTSHINQRALRFYKSLGFHEEGLLKSHFFDGIDEIQLAKFYKYDD